MSPSYRGPRSRRAVRFALLLGLVTLLASCGGGPVASAAAPPSTPVSAPVPTYREATTGLTEHTVYRPRDLSAYPDGSLPVVAYGNGGCAATNLEGKNLLSDLAGRGVVVIANGRIDAFGAGSAGPGAAARPELLIASLDWVEGTEGRAQLQNKVDPAKLVVAGQSCGGIEALLAGADPRVRAVIGLNTGFFPEPMFGGYGRDRLTKLHTPTLIVNGGPADIAHGNSVENFGLLTVPAVLVEAGNVGHIGLIVGLDGDQHAPELVTTTGRMMADWIRFTVDGDPSARGRFLGPGCGLCDVAGWKVQTKGF